MDHRRNEKLVREVVRGLIREITDLENRICAEGTEKAKANGLFIEHEAAIDRLQQLRRRAA